LKLHPSDLLDQSDPRQLKLHLSGLSGLSDLSDLRRLKLLLLRPSDL